MQTFKAGWAAVESKQRPQLKQPQVPQPRMNPSDSSTETPSSSNRSSLFEPAKRITGFMEASSSWAPSSDKILGFTSRSHAQAFEEEEGPAFVVGSPPSSEFNASKFLFKPSSLPSSNPSLLSSPQENRRASFASATTTRTTKSMSTTTPPSSRAHYDRLKLRYFQTLSNQRVVKCPDGTLQLSEHKTQAHRRSRPIPIRR